MGTTEHEQEIQNYSSITVEYQNDSPLSGVLKDALELVKRISD